MDSCTRIFLVMMRSPGSMESHGEQNWKIAIENCSRGVSSSQLIYEQLFLSYTNTLMKGDNPAPKPLEQEVGQMVLLEENKKHLNSRKMSFTVYSKTWGCEKVCVGKGGSATLWGKKYQKFTKWWWNNSSARLSGIQLLLQGWDLPRSMEALIAQIWTGHHESIRV